MNLYLQLGHGMMEHCRHLISRWGGGTVILSPRDLSPDQLPSITTSGSRQAFRATAARAVSCETASLAHCAVASPLASAAVLPA